MEWLQTMFGDANPWLAAGVTLVAGLVRGFAGFGSAMLMAPIFALLFGSTSMVVTVTAIEIAVSLQLVSSIRAQADWRRTVGPLSLAAAVAMPLGLWLLSSLDTRVVVKLVSGIVLAFVLVSFIGWRYRGTRRLDITLMVGAISGAMMGSTGIGGPPVLMYLLASNEAPETHRANTIGYFMLTSLVLIGLSLWTGIVGSEALLRAVVLAPAMLVGAWIGGRLFHRADPRIYRTVALLLLLAVGLFGLLK